jgi:long-subunit fatty acid transport protein
VKKYSSALGALTFCAVCAAPPAWSSAIEAPHGAARDADLAGNTVAAPDDGASTLLINPAGVVSRARDEALVAALAFSFNASYSNEATGYDGNSARTPIALDLWYGLGEHAGWSFGVGAYGALGAAFDLPADPDNGQTSPFTGELAILNFGLVAGRQLAPNLRFGIQLSPAYGKQRVRSPTPLGTMDFKADGMGLSGIAGLVYTPTPALSLGLAYRTTGFVDMKGDGSVGGVEQDVETHFVTPQNVTGGVAYQWSKQLRLLGQLRWIRYEDFERGDLEFEETTALDQPVMAHTRNRIRWGVALEYELVPNSMLRAGYTEGKAMIEDDAMMPIMFDLDNKMIMLGYEIDYGKFMVGFTTGYMHLETRRVSEEDNMMAPGRYTSDSDVSAGVRVTWKLDRPR